MTTPATTVGVVSLDAARDAVGGMLAALGVPTRPTWSVATDAVLTVLLQASGTRVAVPEDVADHAASVAAAAICCHSGVAS